MHDDLAPYEPNDLDELLSAELDGELGAAARDLGTTLDEVTARMNATPGADARRVALAAARGLLAEPPEIDELLAQRLRAKASRAAAEAHSARDLDRRRRRRQIFLGAAGIAAAAVAVVALAGGLNGNGGGTHTASEKRSGASATAGDTAGSGKSAPLPPTAALGAFTDKRALATAALSRTGTAAQGALGAANDQIANRARSQTTRSTQVSHPASSPATSGAADFGAASGSALKSAPGPAVPAGGGSGSACPTPEGIGADDSLVLRATATLSGKPVVVFVFAGHGEHAIKIENAKCTLVDVEMQR